MARVHWEVFDMAGNIAWLPLVLGAFTTSVFAKPGAPSPTGVASGFSIEQVTLTGSQGDPVPGNLYLPEDAPNMWPKARHPALLLQFGTDGDKDIDYIVELAEGMVELGFVVLTIDMPGRGQRVGTSVEPEAYEDMVRWYMADYEVATNFLTTLPVVDTKKLAYAGTSLGAITGIPYCAADTRIKACISIVGGGSAYSGLPADIDPVQMVSQISPRATMLINGLFDPVIPYYYAKNLHNAVQRPYEKVWYSSEHYLYGVDRGELCASIGDFILRHAR